jgi:hypothetical protein
MLRTGTSVRARGEGFTVLRSRAGSSLEQMPAASQYLSQVHTHVQVGSGNSCPLQAAWPESLRKDMVALLGIPRASKASGRGQTCPARHPDSAWQLLGQQQ